MRKNVDINEMWNGATAVRPGCGLDWTGEVRFWCAVDSELGRRPGQA